MKPSRLDQNVGQFRLPIRVPFWPDSSPSRGGGGTVGGWLDAREDVCATNALEWCATDDLTYKPTPQRCIRKLLTGLLVGPPGIEPGTP